MATQTINGKAFEWSVGCAITRLTGYTVITNESSIKNKECYKNKELSGKLKDEHNRNAEAAIRHIIKKESLSGSGYIKFLSDAAGKAGDVRDIVIINQDKEIGISCKTHHEAFKHSRLSKANNFIKRWGLNENGCSDVYFEEIEPIFNELREIKKTSNNQKKWSELSGVPERFYWPLLNAFGKEIVKSDSQEMCNNFIKYIVGNKDFYKIMSQKKLVKVQAFNLNGTLNALQPKLPTRIEKITNKNSSEYSKIIFFNKGWQFSFRIHSASSKVEPSLKFDITAISLSPDIYTHHIDII
jgi:hypothetical protein